MESIRVELTHDVANDRWDLAATIGSLDVSEHVLGQPMAAFRGYLPSELRNYGRPSQQRTYNLRTFLTRGRRFSMNENPLPPQALTDAIRAYLTEIAPALQGESTVSAVESEMDIAENLAASQPPMLSMGGRLFRLSPVAESAAPLKLLERMRRQAAAAIATQRAALLASATREAAIIREQAAQERAAFERDRLEWKRTRGQEMVIPQWVGDSPVKRTEGNLLLTIEFILYYQPTKFVYPGWVIAEGARRRTVSLEWDAVSLPPVKTFVWLRFNPTDGRYVLENARIDQHWPELPHASHGGFCCQPQGLPERLDSVAGLERVVVAIQRAFKEVNLSSLLTPVERWSPQVGAFMPAQCLEFWDRYQDEGMEQTDPAEFNARIVERERPEEVWAAPGHSADDE